MEKDPDKVASPAEIEAIDNFIVQQWKLKNYNLSDRPRDGIHVIDRAPLDSFAFTKESKWKEKAELTKHGITPVDTAVKLCKGTLILLLGDPRIMNARATSLGKVVEIAKLKYRQELLKFIYDGKIEGVHVIDTREMTAKEVAKRISRIIHIEPYLEFDFQTRLDDFCAGRLVPPADTN